MGEGFIICIFVTARRATYMEGMGGDT